MTDKAFHVRKGLAVNTASPLVTVHIASNDAIKVPIGTTAQRPSGAAGYFRYNTETGAFEGYTSDWGAVGGGGGYFKGNRGTQGTAAGANDIFRINANTISNNITIATGENASATGPLTIAPTFTVTIETGARVSII